MDSTIMFCFSCNRKGNLLRNGASPLPEKKLLKRSPLALQEQYLDLSKEVKIAFLIIVYINFRQFP